MKPLVFAAAFLLVMDDGPVWCWVLLAAGLVLDVVLPQRETQ